MKKPRMYHTRYIEGYRDGIAACRDAIEKVLEHFDDNDEANEDDYIKYIDMLIQHHLRVINYIESTID